MKDADTRANGASNPKLFHSDIVVITKGPCSSVFVYFSDAKLGKSADWLPRVFTTLKCKLNGIRFYGQCKGVQSGALLIAQNHERR